MSRQDWYIHWDVTFMIDTDMYAMSFIPTVVWVPWKYRYPKMAVIDITWLHLHICIGQWKRKGE